VEEAAAEEEEVDDRFSCLILLLRTVPECRGRKEGRITVKGL